MPTILLSLTFAILIFGGLLTCLRLGWQWGRRRLEAAGEDGQAGLGALDGAVFGLTGLLIAFTFTGAASRFHERRDLITQQVNAIGTAWLRLDLLPDIEREMARDGIRRYVARVRSISSGSPPSWRSPFTSSSTSSSRVSAWSGSIHSTRPLSNSVLP